MNNYNHKVRLFKCFMIKCKKTLKGDKVEKNIIKLKHTKGVQK